MIKFNNENITFELKHKLELRSWLNSLLRSEGYEPGELNYVFVDDTTILKMNIQFLGHSYYTDVISFPYENVYKGSKTLLNGDIYISIDTIAANAKEFNTTFNNELCRVMAHGLLHFIGYDDHTPQDIIVMRSKEDYYLSLIEPSLKQKLGF